MSMKNSRRNKQYRIPKQKEIIIMSKHTETKTGFWTKVKEYLYGPTSEPTLVVNNTLIEQGQAEIDREVEDHQNERPHIEDNAELLAVITAVAEPELTHAELTDIVEVVADEDLGALLLEVNGKTVLGLENAYEVGILVSTLLEGLETSGLRPEDEDEDDLIVNLLSDLEEVKESLDIYANGEDEEITDEDVLSAAEVEVFNDLHDDHDLSEDRIKELVAPLLKRNPEVREAIASPDFKGLGMEWTREELGL